jgi:hypothetical protein
VARVEKLTLISQEGSARSFREQLSLQLLVLVPPPVSQARAFPDYPTLSGVLQQHAVLMYPASKFRCCNRELENADGRACPVEGPVGNTVRQQCRLPGPLARPTSSTRTCARASCSSSILHRALRTHCGIHYRPWSQAEARQWAIMCFCTRHQKPGNSQ